MKKRTKTETETDWKGKSDLKMSFVRAEGRLLEGVNQETIGLKFQVGKGNLMVELPPLYIVEQLRLLLQPIGAAAVTLY